MFRSSSMGSRPNQRMITTVSIRTRRKELYTKNVDITINVYQRQGDPDLDERSFLLSPSWVFGRWTFET